MIWKPSLAASGKDRTLARDVELFVVLVVLGNLLIVSLLAGMASPAGLESTFYLAFFIHVGFSLYDGSFSAARTVTWLILIAAWFGAELAAFLGYVIPWGQIGFWLMLVMTKLLPSPGKLFELFARNLQPGSSLAIWTWVLLLLLTLDLAVMHWGRWRGKSFIQIGMYLVTAAAAALLLGFAESALIGSSTTASPVGPYSTPAHIVPAWYELPFFALLRSVPNKLAGVVLMFAAMATPMIWPWMRADDVRTGPMRRVWILLCLIQAMVWFALGYLGSRPPDPPQVYYAQALAVFNFAFFLVFPPLLGRLAAGRKPDAKSLDQR